MRRILKILIATSVFFTMAGGMIGPIYAVYVEQIGGDILSTGGAYAIFALAAGMLTLITAKWEDHLKHIEKMVVLGYLLSSIGFFIHLLVKSPTQLFFVQALFGFSAAILNPAYDVLYSKYLQKNRVTSGWGIWEAENLIVTAVASLMGAYIAKMYGFRILLMLMFGFSVVGFSLSLFLLSKRVMMRIFSIKSLKNVEHILT